MHFPIKYILQVEKKEYIQQTFYRFLCTMTFPFIIFFCLSLIEMPGIRTPIPKMPTNANRSGLHSTERRGKRRRCDTEHESTLQIGCRRTVFVEKGHWFGFCLLHPEQLS